MSQTNFRATEILAGKNCNCLLSKNAGKRLLSKDLQSLLANSDFLTSCTCTFKHYTDRRIGLDRRRFDVNSISSPNKMRKNPYGRRVIDVHNRAKDHFIDERLHA